MLKWHTFNPSVAVDLGTDRAIVFCVIDYWLGYNAKKGINFHEGKYWMFNSAASFEEELPYFSKSQIYRHINSLIESGYLLTGHFNRRGGDRTTWYTLTDKGLKVSMHYTKSAPIVKSETASSKTDNSNIQNRNFEVSNSQLPSCKNETALPTVTPTDKENRYPQLVAATDTVSSRVSNTNIQLKLHDMIEKAGIKDPNEMIRIGDYLSAVRNSPDADQWLLKALDECRKEEILPPLEEIFRKAAKLYTKGRRQ